MRAPNLGVDWWVFLSALAVAVLVRLHLLPHIGW